MGSDAARTSALVVLGPTASGKTAVAVALATRVSGEIISADSRAFFQGLDIVTDKPTSAERRGVPHHLIDHVPIDGEYDAMSFRAHVARLIPDIRGRGHQPIIAGGGTVYLGAILRGLFEGPEKDEQLRAALREAPLDDLRQELRACDPVAAARIHPNDRLRLMRAVEVYRTTGKPMSQWQAEATPLDERFEVIGLHRERSEHRQAIEARIRHMLASGLLDEIARLRASGLSPETQAYRTIGVPEACHLLDGELSEEEFVDRVASRTWQLVRRQMAWFRRDNDVRWIDVTGRSADDIAAEIVTEVPT